MSRLTIGCCALLLAIAALWHGIRAAGALRSELASYDAPAQFTTGVMVHDYLTTALGTNPVAFAESFYVRFPKVAIGQWPPVYFAAQAVWYLVFPATPASARVLTAVTALAIALAIFLRLRGPCGVLAACAAVSMWLSLPRVQWMSWTVMSDVLTALFMFLAMLSFSTFLREPRRARHAWYFALWSSAALLTKGSAVVLAPFAALAPLLAWRPRCYRAVWYWVAGIVTVIVSAPFYILVGHMGFGYSTAGPATGPSQTFSRLIFLEKLWNSGTPLVWTVVAAGFAAAVFVRWRRGDDGPATTDALVAGACILSQLFFLMAFPLTQEARVFVPALPPAAILFGYCLSRIQSVLLRRPAFSTVAPAALAVLCAATCGIAEGSHTEGYQSAVDAIPYRPEGSLMLASGNAYAEGAMIVDRLAHDSRRAGIVLRASRLLAETSWSGLHYRPRFADAAAVGKYLFDLPVRYILLDDTQPTPYGKLLDDAIRADPEGFALLGRFPIRGDGRLLGDVRVYENRRAGDRRPAVVRVALGLERGARVLEYHWK